eukprot:SAG22_NODE_3869_length_1488_cov_2.057595_3_plen_153_part_00
MGVQVRDLRSLLDEYDGEVVVAKILRSWEEEEEPEQQQDGGGGGGGPLVSRLRRDPVTMLEFQQMLTKLHRYGRTVVEQCAAAAQAQSRTPSFRSLARSLTRLLLLSVFYQRAYSCNCFLCVATICGEDGCCSCGGTRADVCAFCFAKYSSR